MNPSELEPIYGMMNYPVSLWIRMGGIALCLFVLGGICIIGYKYFCKKKVTVTDPPWVITMMDIKTLLKTESFSNAQWEIFFVELSYIIRQYIEVRFLIRAPDMTSEEFLDHIRNAHQMNESHKVLLKDFCEACDKVKFARYSPMKEDVEKVVDKACIFVEQSRED